MLYQIMDGTVSQGGKTVLSHIDFEIRGREKIGLVGKNGAGKTTLLRLLAGELALDRDDRRSGPGTAFSRSLTVGMMRQQPFADLSLTAEEAFMAAFLRRTSNLPGNARGFCKTEDHEWERERFAYEREWDAVFTRFGFAKKDRKKRLSSFSGGEQTKIALIRLLLERPDILLLDEPTNHLDMETAAWLEEYLRSYEKAVVMVSHDRFLLDQTAEVIYELEGGSLTRYAGNYTEYRKQKWKRLRLQKRAYDRQQEELQRLGGLVERFKHKPNKASFARAKKKAMERMERVEKPEEDEGRIVTGELTPLVLGSKRVFEAEHLKIGYERVLLDVTLRIGRGQKIGVLGPNGSGKSTFLKTVAGLIPPLDGRLYMGLNVVMGYFDQHSAEISSSKTVVDHFCQLFPAMTEKEARSSLGAYLFGGREAGVRVDSLSGGEKARLWLAELLQSRPNFLILDEPTNHMDIRAREVLESAFQAYSGTLLFVTHDRYFLKEVADSLLIFEGHSVFYYPFGYEHYVKRQQRAGAGEPAACRKAEEQALIDGLRSVPKAERHRLKEPSARETYLDWRFRPLRERLEAAAMVVKERSEQLWAAEREWRESEAFWEECLGGGKQECLEEIQSRHLQEEGRELIESLVNRLSLAERSWQEACMEWYDAWLKEEAGERTGSV